MFLEVEGPVSGPDEVLSLHEKVLHCVVTRHYT